MIKAGEGLEVWGDSDMEGGGCESLSSDNNKASAPTCGFFPPTPLNSDKSLHFLICPQASRSSGRGQSFFFIYLTCARVSLGENERKRKGGTLERSLSQSLHGTDVCAVSKRRSTLRASEYEQTVLRIWATSRECRQPQRHRV